jgi:hypothetical protein
LEPSRGLPQHNLFRVLVRAGNTYAGLWYPIVVSLLTVAVGALFLRETKDRSILE